MNKKCLMPIQIMPKVLKIGEHKKTVLVFLLPTGMLDCLGKKEKAKRIQEVYLDRSTVTVCLFGLVRLMHLVLPILF